MTTTLDTNAPHRRATRIFAMLLAVGTALAPAGCYVHTRRHADVVYVHHARGGGPVHGAVHGVHCIEHAATLRGCD